MNGRSDGIENQSTPSYTAPSVPAHPYVNNIISIACAAVNRSPEGFHRPNSFQDCSSPSNPLPESCTMTRPSHRPRILLFLLLPSAEPQPSPFGPRIMCGGHGGCCGGGGDGCGGAPCTARMAARHLIFRTPPRRRTKPRPPSPLARLALRRSLADPSVRVPGAHSLHSALVVLICCTLVLVRLSLSISLMLLVRSSRSPPVLPPPQVQDGATTYAHDAKTKSAMGAHQVTQLEMWNDLTHIITYTQELSIAYRNSSETHNPNLTDLALVLKESCK